MTTATTGATPEFDLAAPLHTDDDVLRRVDLLLDDNARQVRSVVLMFLAADGGQLPVVVPIDDVRERPDPMLVDSVCWVIAEALAQHPGGAAVIVLTRPGAGQPAEADMRWCRLLIVAARRHRAAIRMVCLATPAGVRSLATGSHADTG